MPNRALTVGRVYFAVNSTKVKVSPSLLGRRGAVVWLEYLGQPMVALDRAV
jgi:hypothetical protein